jgi:hypothetical protein
MKPCSIYLRCSGFTDSYLGVNGGKDIWISEEKLISAAVMIGAQSLAEVFGGGVESIAFAFHKAFAMLTSVDLSNTKMMVSRYYHKLDQSEKASLSYWIGMAMCKIIAQDVLNIPYLQHAANLKSTKRTSLSDPKSRSLPDLVGKDSKGVWHVMEAKARQKEPSKKISDEWKKQACQIRTIDGLMPGTRSYCLSMVRRQLFDVKLVDPPFEPDSEHESQGHFDGIDIEIGMAEFLRQYYGPILNMLERYGAMGSYERDSLQPVLAQVAYDPATRTYWGMGLVNSVFRQIMEHEHVTLVESRMEHGQYISSDGVIIQRSSKPLSR